MNRRGFLAGAVVAAVLPILTGCGMQPLYGPGLSGFNTGTALSSVDIAPIPGRVGQVVRNELIFKTTGGGTPPESAYRLDIALRESAQSLLVQQSGEAQGLVVALDADFRLIRLSDNAVVLTSKAASRAVYQQVESVFANVRARRDAQDRAAREMADSVRTRVAAYLSGSA